MSISRRHPNARTFASALLCPWDPGKCREGSISPSSAVTPAVFGSNCSTIRKTQRLPGSSSGIQPAARHRTGDVWHVWVAGIPPGQLYAYRVDGPYDPGKGPRFNFNRLLLDPLATAISRLPAWDFASAQGYDSCAPEKDLARSTRDNSASMPKCVLINEPFDWQADKPPRHLWSKAVIYETHVRGFTIHPSSGVEHPGTPKPPTAARVARGSKSWNSRRWSEPVTRPGSKSLPHTGGSHSVMMLPCGNLVGIEGGVSKPGEASGCRQRTRFSCLDPTLPIRIILWLRCPHRSGSESIRTLS